MSRRSVFFQHVYCIEYVLMSSSSMCCSVNLNLCLLACVFVRREAMSLFSMYVYAA